MAIAFYEESGNTSYQDLEKEVRLLKSNLEKTGILSGQAICFLGKSNRQAVLLILACFELNLVFMPLNLRLATSQWQEQIDLVKPALIIADKEFHKSSIKNQAISFETIEYSKSLEGKKEYSAGIIVSTSGGQGSAKVVFLSKAALLNSAKTISELLNLTASDCWLLSLPIIMLVASV